MTVYAATFEDVLAAHERIAGRVHRTPVLTCGTLDELSGRSLFFKCENMQRVGAFKFRGATNAVCSLDDEVASRGVCTHSSGNHAQALALAARQRDIPAWIVMPTSAPEVKRRAVEGYGATIVPCEPTLEARETTCAGVIEETGATLVHPYDDPRVIAGQGTAARELIEEVGELDVVVAPVGGGGLMSGSCITTRAMLPGALPSICLASSPTACTSFVLLFMATTEGSRKTIPCPLTFTSVLAVPRSIAKSLENKSQKKFSTQLPSFTYLAKLCN